MFVWYICALKYACSCIVRVWFVLGRLWSVCVYGMWVDVYMWCGVGVCRVRMLMCVSVYCVRESVGCV